MSASGRAPLVAVCGTSTASAAESERAAAVGRGLAERGAVVLCGGLGGVMAAVAAGVRSAGGICVGLLPGDDPAAGCADLTLAIPTGLGEMRNALLARACAGMVAIGGGYGTLGEIGLGLRLGRPVVGIGTWGLTAPGGTPDPGVTRCRTAEEAVRRVLELIAAGGR